ncbi:PAS domain-containing sensor histidine kinase [Dyadobacter fanqingshengii]|uniref:histidine kinase n=1 Tax=Dyadobacter fanqingshengii TaxID=2906443 RepID=A0A9X1T9N7_9BACT|nr:ATP-binding protein [Dyadobacter fanqingshengii]MCF0041495.1 ATP-binding protein [Dyadobacter fanqingshengii]MCF2505404.1 ATP-binding protein [Dyadobacter fanqingshengii]USJ36786.1 ATP-binding protein [Dyadobacter fanqingshengii]
MQQAENILQDLPCGCVIFTETGMVTFINRTLCSVLGFQVEDVQGKSVEVVMTISSRIFHQTHFFPLLKLKGQVSEIFLSLRANDGSSIPMMANAKSITENGEPCYICVYTPVWERQKYENQLLEVNRAQQKALDENAMLNRLKDELESNQFNLDRKISILAERSREYLQMGKVFMHDMQEPIRKISLFFDTFLRKEGIPQNAGEHSQVEIIKRSILRLKFLTGSLLDFVQNSVSDDPVTLLNPGALIQQASAELTKKHGPFDYDINIGDLPEFDGRAVQIKRVFIELLKNAVENKASDRKLAIRVTAIVSEENAYQNHSAKYRYTDHVKIEFADNGAGFDNRFNEYVFGLLNKLNMGTPGPGLGLALCKQIIAGHYGTIQAKSEVGKGTSIVIMLPLRQMANHNQIV